MKIFSSIEFCIYFSIKSLSNMEWWVKCKHERQHRSNKCFFSILKFLKSPAILELQQNIYVKTFSNLFKEDSEILNHCLSTEVIFWRFFKIFYKNICFLKELKSKSRLVFFELKQVPFYADIHVRENFPIYSDTLFVAFKSQR